MRSATIPRDPFLQKQNADTFSAHFRRRRFSYIEPIIRRSHSDKGACSIIDVGGREEYWLPILATLAECNAKVTIVNFEKTNPSPDGISNLPMATPAISACIQPDNSILRTPIP
jgi:hypothetical protein